MSKRKVAFIINPVSGTKKKTKIVKTIQSFANPIYEYKIYITQAPGDAVIKAKEYVEEGYDLIVAVGGDGTVNEVASALVGSTTTFGIIPVGSGNGLARALYIPLKLKNSLNLLESGMHTTIDVCTFNGHSYFCTAGVGYDAAVGAMFANAHRRGFLTYLIAGIQAYIKLRPAEYQLKIDDKSIEQKAFCITFANAGQFGNDAYIAPLADIRDGLIDVVIIRPFPWYKCFFIGMRLFFKNMHKSKYVDVYKCKKATLTRPEKDCAHFDGEAYIEGRKIEVGIKPLDLKIIIPQKNE